METDGVTRVFYLRNDSHDKYVEQIYPSKQARTSNLRAIREVESRVDAHFIAVHYKGEVSWRLLEQSEQFRQACKLKLKADVAKGNVNERLSRLVAYIEKLKQRGHQQTAFTIVVG